jgi:hypothetical protein
MGEAKSSEWGRTWESKQMNLFKTLNLDMLEQKSGYFWAN